MRSDEASRTMLVVLALLLLSAMTQLPVQGQGDGLEVGGSISTDSWWNLTDSPVHATSDVTVEEGVNLTIQKGVVVKFDSWAGLTVKGSLVAEGVTFTSSSMSPSSGSWDGITFKDTDHVGHPLKDLQVLYGDYGIVVDGARVVMVGGSILYFDMSGVVSKNEATLKLSGTRIWSSDGDGIECRSYIEAADINVAGEFAVDAQAGCSGRIERSIITANDMNGIMAGMDSTMTFEGNLINTTTPYESTGVDIEVGSRIKVVGNDIVGHMHGIELESEFAKVDGNNIRNYLLNGIYSDVTMTVDDVFWGNTRPDDDTIIPDPATDEITITNPRSEPIDLPGIPQPPSVAVTSPKDAEMVKGIVTIRGKAWDPDPGDTILSVEIKIVDAYDNVITGWKKCSGTKDWSFSWDTKDLEADSYYVVLRVESGEDRLVYKTSFIIVNPWISGGGSGGWDIMAFYYTCIGIAVAVGVVVLVVLVYVFVIRKKKRPLQQQATTAQPYQQPHAQTYDQQYQYQAQPQPQSQPQPQQVPPPPAVGKAEDVPYIIEDVFLIYKDGRLIHHDARRLKPEMDDQMLGGMFTAIQEFIGTSFSSYDGAKGQVKEIMYEDSRIVLEHGDHVYLAVVCTDIKDTTALHERMSKLIMAIEKKGGQDLKEWDGDLTSVKEAKGMTRLIFTDDPIDLYLS